MYGPGDLAYKGWETIFFPIYRPKFKYTYHDVFP